VELRGFREMTCSHESCSREERIWLPVENNRGSDISLHHWCLHCGLVKTISDDRPHRLGYWMDILSRISFRYSIVQCLRRLIARELQSHKEFNDTYGVTGSVQMEMFVKIVQKHCIINKNNIDSFLC